MLLDYPAGGVPHEAAAHGRCHAELEAGESDGGAAEAGGHEQGGRHRHALRPVPILKYNCIVLLIPLKTDTKSQFSVLRLLYRQIGISFPFRLYLGPLSHCWAPVGTRS